MEHLFCDLGGAGARQSSSVCWQIAKAACIGSRKSANEAQPLYDFSALAASIRCIGNLFAHRP